MIRNRAFCLFVILGILVTSCADAPKTTNINLDSVGVSHYKIFEDQFTMIDSMPKLFDNENGLKWYNHDNTIADTLFQAVLKDKSFHDFKNKTEIFAKSEKMPSFQYVCKAPLNKGFHSFLVSARGKSKTQRWKTFLVNFSRDGDFRDAILISYRDSYENETTKNKVQYGEYRTAQFLKGRRIKVHDVVYNSQIDNPNISDPEEKPLEDNRYDHVITYQIRFDGTFTVLKDEEKQK